MRSLIVAAGLVLAATAASAQTANSPTFTREQQGGDVVTGQVTCASTSTSVYSGNGDARAIVISAADNNGAYLCPRTGVSSPATPVPCTAATAGAVLAAAGQNVTLDRSVKGVSVSCVRAGGENAVIHYVVQK